MKKWTNELFDQSLLSNKHNIKRIGDIVSYNKPISMKCLDCKHEWSTVASNICRLKCGCPKCSNIIKLSNKDIDYRLKGKNIKRISNYERSGKTMEWKCEICKNKWHSSADNVLNKNKRGCGKCNGGIKKPDEYYIKKLEKNNIYLIGKIKNSSEKIEMKCGKCKNKWFSTLNNTCRSKNPSGCPKCLYKRESFVGDLLAKHLSEQKINTHVVIKTEERNFNIDFIINNNLFIEYNGEQHYMPIYYNLNKVESIKRLRQVKKRDKQLRKYCKEKKIILIEIPFSYTDKQIEETIINIKEILS